MINYAPGNCCVTQELAKERQSFDLFHLFNHNAIVCSSHSHITVTLSEERYDELIAVWLTLLCNKTALMVMVIFRGWIPRG